MQARLRLTQRRRALGYSQESLAETLGVDRTTVGRWERGKTSPEPYIRPKLCRLFQVSPDELTVLLGETGHIVAPATVAPGPPADRPGEGNDDMYRRDLLRLVTAGAVYLALPPGSSVRAAEGNDTGQHEQLSARLWQVYALAPSKRSVYPVVHDQLAGLIGQLGDTPSPGARLRLCTLTANTLQLAGEIRFDAGDYPGAAHCYTLAASTAREARQYDLWACAMTRLSYLSIGDLSHDQAAAVLTAAARVARRGDSSLPTRYWIANVQAQVFAAQGNAAACERALDESRQVTGSSGPGGWLRFDASRLDEETHPDRAEPYLTRALSPAPTLRRRGSLLTDLATLGLQQHDTGQLLRYAHQAAELAEATHSAGYLGRKLTALRGQLAPLRADPRIAELDQRIAKIVPRPKDPT